MNGREKYPSDSPKLAEVRSQIDEGFDRLDKRQDEQDAWISKLEGQMNTARHGRLSSGDNALNGLPADEPIRKQVEVAEKMGYTDPVRTVGMGYWWQCQLLAKLSARNPTSTPPSEYLRRADKWEESMGFDPQEKFRLDAISKGAVGEGAGGGASIIALPVEAELRRLIRDANVFNKYAQHIIMTSVTHQLPVENSAVTAYLVPEVTVITDSMPSTSYAAVALTAKKYGGLATISNEVVTDNIIGIYNVVFRQIAESMGQLEDQSIFNSANGVTGLSSVSGRFTTNVSGFAAAGNNQGSVPIWFDVVTAAFKALQNSTRANGRWFMHPGVYKNILSNVDTTGQPVVAFSNSAQTPVSGQIPFSICGFPVELSSVISTQDSVYTTSSSVYFLDPSRVVYGDLLGLRFDLDQYGLFSSDQSRIRVLQRLGIAVPVGTYVSQLQGAKAI
jgi:HK97 family phage major capsid protein